MKRAIEMTAGLLVLFLWVSAAQAIKIVVSEVQNDVAVVEGNKAAKSVDISWEGDVVTQTTNGGAFQFSGVVPDDCVGTLSDGVDTIEVAVLDCTPAPAPPSGGVSQTGQTQCDQGDNTLGACPGSPAGQDGDVLAGVALPQPRFTDNGDGTITDNLTGLIWLKNANCFNLRTWAEALADANNLADGQCGLSDGSVAGNWVLPNVRQLFSLIHFEFSNPAVSNGAGTGQAGAGDPFTNLQNFFYWSSTTFASFPSNAWNVNLDLGNVGNGSKAFNNFVTAVRGP